VRTLSRGEESSGTHLAVWNGKDNIGRNVSSGVYFLSAEDVNGHSGNEENASPQMIC
jgi:flagellar hook assembly protein FlgD